MSYQHRVMRYLVVALLIGLFAPLGGVVHARTITGFLTFETGGDGQAILLPGVSFTTAAGNPWIYGDVRTHKYNAPYPADCSDRPTNIASPICQYAVGEDIFAWTGATSVDGRIAFTGGTASFVDFDLSTGVGVTVLAYNQADKAISAAYVRPNAAGSGERAVKLDAPSGEQIAYVTLSGSANLWLLDNLATDAPLVPDQRPPDRSAPALVTVVQRVESAPTIAPGSALTLTVVATNRGHGIANDATLTLPINPALFRVDDATFSRAEAWVSTLNTTAMTMRTGVLWPGGDTITATIRLTVLSTANSGGTFGDPIFFKWGDAVGGGSGSSNSLGMSVGGPAFAPSLGTSKVVDGVISFSSATFAPDEPVGVWYNMPDGKVIGLDTIRADKDGVAAFRVDVSGLPAGSYSMVTYGHWTEFTAVAPFTVGGSTGS